MAIRNIGCKSAAALLAVLLVSCGGGGSGSNANASGSSNQLQGTVAVGKPLSGVKVTVISMTPNVGGGYDTVDATTDANGRYSVAPPFPPPYHISAANADFSVVYPYMISVAMNGGTANVTPLTDLLVTQLLGKPESYFTRLEDMAILKNANAQQISDARQKVVDYLLTRPNKADQSATSPVDATAVTDFLAANFQPKAGDTYDDVLENLSQSLLPGENLYSLRESMLNGKAAPLDLQAQAAGLYACEGNVCGPSSNGSIGTPDFPKYALVQALMQQIKNDLSVQVDCGPAPALPGFQPGNNRLVVDGTVLRMNDSSGYAIPMTSLVNPQIAIDNTNASPSKKYISSLDGSNSFLLVEGFMGITLAFDDLARISTVTFISGGSGNQKSVTCTRI